MEAIKRRSRRSKTPKPFPGRLSELHQRVLLALEPRPLLPSHYIYALVGGEYAWFKRAMRKLCDWGLVDKPTDQDHAINRNGMRAIYRLSEKGFNKLKKRGLTTSAMRPPSEQFPHELLKNEIVTGVEIALLEHPHLRYIPAHEFITDEMTFPVEISVEIDGTMHRHKTTYNPDGWFGIQYRDGSRIYFCLEVNHKGNVRNLKNITKNSHLKKFLSIRELRRNGTFKKYFGDVPVVSLFAQIPDLDRDDREHKTKNSMELLASLSKGGSPRYWFATFDNYLDALRSITPEEVWRTVWRRVNYPDATLEGGLGGRDTSKAEAAD